MVRARGRLSQWGHIGERQSDHVRHSWSNAIELLQPVRIRPELVQGLDVLSLQHLPGNRGQIETRNGSGAGVVKVGYRTLPWLAGGSTHISQPSVPGSFKPAIICCTPLPNIPPAPFHKRSITRLVGNSRTAFLRIREHECLPTNCHGNRHRQHPLALLVPDLHTDLGAVLR